MLLIDLAGYELTQEEQELLEHPLVSGLILFTRNFHDKAQLQALIKSVRQRVKKPLLITVDQEGGLSVKDLPNCLQCNLFYN